MPGALLYLITDSLVGEVVLACQVCYQSKKRGGLKVVVSSSLAAHDVDCANFNTRAWRLVYHWSQPLIAILDWVYHFTISLLLAGPLL